MDIWIDGGQRETQRNLKLRILHIHDSRYYKGFQETHWTRVEAHPWAQRVTCQVEGPRWWGPRGPGKVTQAGSGEKHKMGTHQALRWHPRAGLGFRRVLPLSPGICMSLPLWLPCKRRDPGPQMLPRPWVPQWTGMLAHPSCPHEEPQNHLKKADPRISWDPRTWSGIKRALCLESGKTRIV